MTYDLFDKSTSSPASASGALQRELRASLTMRPYGQDLALASLSPRQAKERDLLTSGTYGPPSTISSNSAALTSSLASRLREQVEMLGSTLFKLTWKQRIMPSGRLKPSLAASARRTNDPATIGWPTTRAADGDKNVRTLEGSLSEIARKGSPQDIAMAAAPASWPTPVAQPANGTPENFLKRKRKSIARGSSMGISLTDINMVAQLTSWPTPQASDMTGGGQAKLATNPDRSNDLNDFAMLASWHTPLARDGDKLDATPPAIEKRMKDGREIGTAMQARMASDSGWSDHPGPARLTVSGEMLTGSDAGTKSGGQLSPAHSLWLMLGPFATAWASSGERVMRSRSGKRSASSLPSSKSSKRKGSQHDPS